MQAGEGEISEPVVSADGEELYEHHGMAVEQETEQVKALRIEGIDAGGPSSAPKSGYGSVARARVLLM